jgi:hypothetical protein
VKKLIHIPTKILHPDPYLTPAIHMSPFSGKMGNENFINNLDNINDIEVLDRCSQTLFGKKLNGIITTNGREAISFSLDQIVNKPNFTIGILTTSGSGYVSSCVIKEIQKKKCNHIFGENSKVDAYFIIHDFGRYMKIPNKVINSGKPIIEDCAWALVDNNFFNSFGKVGDYIIYSLSKSFEMQYGGLLFAKNNNTLNIKKSIKTDFYILNKLNYSISNLKIFNQQRLDNYYKMKSISESYGFEEAYKYYEGEGVPHSFMVKIDKKNQYNQQIKSYMNRLGIESSFFYGGGAYFLPCHQNLSDLEIQYIFYHFNYIINEC